MRCPDCNKFVAYDTDVEPEEETAPDIDSDGRLTASYTRILNCAECGTELKRGEVEVEIEAEIDPASCAPEDTECPYCAVAKVEQEECPKCDTDWSDDSHVWEMDDLTSEATMRTEGSGRGTKTFYGVNVSGTITCSRCKLEVEVNGAGEIQASSMEES